MQKGCVCVAGIDLETGLHIRPILERQMPIDMLSLYGGPFDIAHIVDLGATRFVGKIPEVEDQRFETASAQHVTQMPPDEFWKLLESTAHEKLGSIFGPELERIGETCAIIEAHGLRSLGCYWAESGRLLIHSGNGGPRVRFSWQSGEHHFNVPVTDIRLYGADHVTPCVETVEQLNTKIAAEPRVLLSVGLSRPYRKSAKDPARHWLQINNFHLPDRPCWKLTDKNSGNDADDCLE
jgi:hypothetical protein